MIGWNFPSNGGGLIRGVAEAGIQTFTGKEISSLTREVCQNSLDAIVDENSAVTVEFQLHKIFSRNIPGCNDYKTVLSKCRDFWKDNLKAKNFLDRAREKINLLETLVLRISDYNTTGLAEPFNPLARDGWNALTKIDGGATKTGDAAGSFGIGKNAPFANSFYRLVFYRTLNQKDERAAQGMSRIVSFQLKPDDISAGIGYYGETQKNMPVEKIDELENLSQRNKPGTDIFIYGFNGGANWLDEIICELLENFLVAIHRGKLSVNLQKFSVDKNNLVELLNKYGDKVQNAVNYYKILSGNAAVKFFERDFHGMGKLKLGVLMDSKIKLNRKVLVVRKNGMKIFEQDRISRIMSFTGILELEGRDLNEFFREMETPSHDKWEPTRYEKNPKLAKDYLKELKRWVRETILSLNEENISDEINVEGLSHMLDFDDGTSTGDSEVETIDNPSAPENSPQELPKDKAINKPQVNSKPQPGDMTYKKNDPPAIRTGSGTRKRITSANHTGKKNPRGVNIVFEPIDCDKIRVIKVGDKKYKLLLKVSRDISEGILEISAVGENNSGEKLFITEATCAYSSLEVRAKGDKISFKNLQAGVETKITFELRDAGNYALGVAIYEDRAHVIKIDDKKYKLIFKVPRDIPEGRIEISTVEKNNSGEKLFIAAATCADSSVEVRAVNNKINFKNLRAGVETKITFELRDTEDYALGVAVYENQC